METTSVSTNVDAQLSRFQIYYRINAESIKKHVADRRRLVRNSRVYLDSQRGVVIQQLNEGTKKWISTKMQDKMKIQQDPDTLKYY